MVYTLGLCDGFDHYAPADAGRKYRQVTGGFTLVPGPHQGSAARFAGGGNSLDPGRGAALASRGAGVWLYLHGATWGAAARVCPLALVRLASGAYGVKQALYVLPDGTAEVRREPSGVLLAASPPGTVPADAWTYVCYSSSLSTGTSGRVDVWVDGAPAASATGLRTCDASPATCTDVRLGNCLADGNGVTLDLDDYGALYRFDTTGPDPDPPAQTGPHAVATLYPVGPGDAADFPTAVGAPGGAHWAASAEAVGDGDASYVEKALGANPVELYRVSPYNAATPALPADRLSDAGWQVRGTVWALLAPVAGGNGFASVLLRYRDQDGVETTDDLRAGLAAGSWPGDGWRYAPGDLDTSRAALQTLQAGYGGADWFDADGQAYRGSQLAVELWYPVGAPAAPPAAGGQRWSVGGLP